MLYTEMVTAPAVIHGPRERLLGFNPEEHPVALQLGGSDPGELARAVRLARDWGYDEINLNCRLSLRPRAVGMFRCGADGATGPCCGLCGGDASGTGAGDGQMPHRRRRPAPARILPAFLDTVAAAGVRHVIIHARKAWLQGLSPKQNREIPPLDHELVFAMKRARPDLLISLNGGIASLDQARSLLDQGIDGVMLGRAAYHDPGATLIGADALWGEAPGRDAFAVVEAMRPYIARHMAAGGRLHQVTRHMLGLFSGRPGARGWRRVLSEGAARPGAGLEVLDAALAELAPLAVAG